MPPPRASLAPRLPSRQLPSRLRAACAREHHTLTPSQHPSYQPPRPCALTRTRPPRPCADSPPGSLDCRPPLAGERDGPAAHARRVARVCGRAGRPWLLAARWHGQPSAHTGGDGRALADRPVVNGARVRGRYCGGRPRTDRRVGVRGSREAAVALSVRRASPRIPGVWHSASCVALWAVGACHARTARRSIPKQLGPKLGLLRARTHGPWQSHVRVARACRISSRIPGARRSAGQLRAVFIRTSDANRRTRTARRSANSRRKSQERQRAERSAARIFVHLCIVVI